MMLFIEGESSVGARSAIYRPGITIFGGGVGVSSIECRVSSIKYRGRRQYENSVSMIDSAAARSGQSIQYQDEQYQGSTRARRRVSSIEIQVSSRNSVPTNPVSSRVSSPVSPRVSTRQYQECEDRLREAEDGRQCASTGDIFLEQHQCDQISINQYHSLRKKSLERDRHRGRKRESTTSKERKRARHQMWNRASNQAEDVIEYIVEEGEAASVSGRRRRREKREGWRSEEESSTTLEDRNQSVSPEEQEQYSSALPHDATSRSHDAKEQYYVDGRISRTPEGSIIKHFSRPLRRPRWFEL